LAVPAWRGVSVVMLIVWLLPLLLNTAIVVPIGNAKNPFPDLLPARRNRDVLTRIGQRQGIAGCLAVLWQTAIADSVGCDSCRSSNRDILVECRNVSVRARRRFSVKLRLDGR